MSFSCNYTIFNLKYAICLIFLRLHASLYRQQMLKRRFTRQIYMNTWRAQSAKMRRVHFAINAFDFVVHHRAVSKLKDKTFMCHPPKPRFMRLSGV